MFERFTDRARRVVVLAQEEARLLQHNYIGTEHILLGLIAEDDGLAAKVLVGLDLSLEGLRTEVEEIIGTGCESPTGHIPFTPRAKKVLELSLREALQLSHNYIGTEHILLGLMREGEGVAAQVLAKKTEPAGGLPAVRAQVLALLEQHSQSGSGAGSFGPTGPVPAAPRCPRCRRGLAGHTGYRMIEAVHAPRPPEGAAPTEPAPAAPPEGPAAPAEGAAAPVEAAVAPTGPPADPPADPIRVALLYCTACGTALGPALGSPAP